MKKVIQVIDEDAAEKYANVHYREDSRELYGNITRDFLAGCAYGREQEKKKLEIALDTLGKIALRVDKCLLGPPIDTANDFIERASSSDDLICWSFELGSHRAYSECAIEAKEVLKQIEGKE